MIMDNCLCRFRVETQSFMEVHAFQSFYDFGGNAHFCLVHIDGKLLPLLVVQALDFQVQQATLVWLAILFLASMRGLTPATFAMMTS